MSCADSILQSCLTHGLRLVSGVPCSSLGHLIDAAERREDVAYVPAANEGDAVAIATGVWLGGQAPGLVVCQNSGIGNAVSPLTSLVATIRAPLLAYVGWRGGPRTPDEPQHELMGSITRELLELCGIDVLQDRGTEGGLLAATREGLDRVVEGRRVAILVTSDVLRGKGRPFVPSLPHLAPPDTLDVRSMGVRPSRVAILRELVRVVPTAAALMSTTGKTSRELFTIGDRENQFYQVGAMGCVSSLALGVAQATRRPIVAIDGDGAALMRLGALSTIGALQPPNLLHVLLDNECHDSTGGQRTTSGTTDLAEVAISCGYRRVARCDSIEGLNTALQWAWRAAGPTFVHVKISEGSMDPLGRPTFAPDVSARRFRDFMTRAA